MKKRWWLDKRVWFLFALIIDIVVALFSFYLDFPIDSTIILIIVIDNFLAQLHMLSEITPHEETKVLTESKDILELAKEYIHEAERGDTVIAMWTVMKFDDALRNYFKETLSELSSKGIIIQRLIDINHIDLSSIATHIIDSQEFLKKKLYRIVFVADAPRFEMLLVGNKNGIIFNWYKDVTLATGCKYEKIINRLHGFYTTSILSETSLDFKANEDFVYDEKNVKKYLIEIKNRLGKYEHKK